MILEKLLRKGGRRRLSNENSDISNPAENSKHIALIYICQASLYSLLFGADGPPLASDEDLSAKLEILSKTIFDGCDKNQDGGAFEK